MCATEEEQTSAARLLTRALFADNRLMRAGRCGAFVSVCAFSSTSIISAATAGPFSAINRPKKGKICNFLQEDI